MLALLQEAASSSAAPAWLQVVREAGQAFQAWATPLILAVGGGFALYRFRRGRTFEKRLKVEVSGRVERATGIAGSTEPEGLVYLLVTVVVTNIGDSAVTVDADLLTVEALEVPGDGSPPWEASWADLWGDSGVRLGLPKFAGGKTLEPGEPVEERSFLGTAFGSLGAFLAVPKAATLGGPGRPPSYPLI